MSTQLMRSLEGGAHPTQEISDEEFVRAALGEYKRGSEFRQRDTLSPERALTAGELQALQSVGLALDPEQTRADAERARKESLHVFFLTYHTALTTSAVARMLGVNASRIRQRVKERTLLALVDAGEMRFPKMQFEHGRELPGLRDVLPTLPPSLKPLEVLSWLATPNIELQGDSGTSQSPREFLLATGNAPAVIEAAQALNRAEAA